MNYNIPQYKIDKYDYGEVLHSTILKIFGDELTYNELKFYTRDKNVTSYLEVEDEWFSQKRDYYWRKVYINRKVILEKKYYYCHSCDMNYYLSELELEKEEEED